MDYSYTPQTNHTYAPPTGNKNASYYRACARRVLAGSWVNASLGNFLGMAIQEGAMLLAMLPGFVMVILGMLFAEGEYKGPMVLAIFGFALIYILMFAAAFLVGGPLTVGLSKMHLDLLDRKEFSLGGIFRPFKECFGRSVRLYARYTLVLVGIALLGVVAMMIGIFGVTAILALLAPEIAPFIMIFLMIILYIALILAVMAFALRYAMVFFLIADRPELSAKEAMRASAEMMKGRKWSFFCLQMSFIGWYLLMIPASMITCGIGSMILPYPLVAYTTTASAVFYEEACGGRGRGTDDGAAESFPTDYSPSDWPTGL